MIHLTVAAPMGIDSVFFSFIERLAVQNGHVCVDPPAQQLDSATPGTWIDSMSRSNQHHFVIGYRYPPCYWKLLAQNASTVCLLADPDGIARQVEQIHLKESDAGRTNDFLSSVHAVRHALEATIELAEWTLDDAISRNRIIIPAAVFAAHPSEAFSRLENFYRYAGVTISQSCAICFSEEASPQLNQVYTPANSIKPEIRRLLTMEDSTPRRLEAVAVVFYQGELWRRRMR